MTTKEKIEVMQAYEDGKQIECRKTIAKELGDEEWEDSEKPEWDWVMFEYRIKPELKYRPYNDTDEMIADWMERFGTYDTKVVMPPIWVRLKSAPNATYLICGYQSESVALGIVRPHFLELFEDYTYLDGTPCGKEATE